MIWTLRKDSGNEKQKQGTDVRDTAKADSVGLSS